MNDFKPIPPEELEKMWILGVRYRILDAYEAALAEIERTQTVIDVYKGQVHLRDERIKKLEIQLEHEKTHIVARTAARNYFMLRAEKAEAELTKAKDWIVELTHPEFGHHTLETGKLAERAEEAEAKRDKLRKACQTFVEHVENQNAKTHMAIFDIAGRTYKQTKKALGESDGTPR